MNNLYLIVDSAYNHFLCTAPTIKAAQTKAAYVLEGRNREVLLTKDLFIEATESLDILDSSLKYLPTYTPADYTDGINTVTVSSPTHETPAIGKG